MDLNKNQISAVLGIIAFVIVGTAICIWNSYTPPKTAEEKRADAYYQCVHVTYVNGRDVNNCNSIH